MQVKSFKEWDADINEMAYDNNIARDSMNRTQEWKDVYFTSQFTKLLSDKISSNKYKLYRNGNETYFLTDKDDNYFGHIQLDDGQIISSFSKLKGGFYTLMFTQIFANSNLKQIISDKSLSTGAIRSYEKLATMDNQNSKNFKLNVLINGNIVPFDKDVLMSNDYARVLVTEHLSKIKVEDFIYKISLMDESAGNMPKMYMRMWENNDPFCDIWLYGEPIVE